MCYSARSKGSAQLRTATEDIMVLKQLAVRWYYSGGKRRRAVQSYWTDYDYTRKRGLVLPLVKMVPNSVGLSKLSFNIEEGYHSWSRDSREFAQSNEAFNSRTESGFLQGASGDMCYALFMIPKGTKYYQNGSGEIVSETISYIGLV